MITDLRKREFENTVRYACELLPDECIVKNLSAKIFAADTYYFFSQWANETALIQFMQSEEYQLIRAAYDAMGILEKIEIGYHVEITTIHINQ